jgi:hypothetical protein
MHLALVFVPFPHQVTEASGTWSPVRQTLGQGQGKASIKLPAGFQFIGVIDTFLGVAASNMTVLITEETAQVIRYNISVTTDHPLQIGSFLVANTDPTVTTGGPRVSFNITLQVRFWMCGWHCRNELAVRSIIVYLCVETR